MARWENGAQWDAPGRGAAGRPKVVPAELGRAELSRAELGRAGASRLDAAQSEVYDEAMARFDAFCFWYARPARSRAGLREVAKRLEAYGSPEALRIAEAVRAALDEG